MNLRRIGRLQKARVGSVGRDVADNGKDVAAACIRDTVLGETCSLVSAVRSLTASRKCDVSARQPQLQRGTDFSHLMQSC